MKKFTVIATFAALISTSAFAVDIYNTNGFEGFALGNANGQGGITTTVASGADEPQIVDFMGNKALKLSTPAPTGNERREARATFNFGQNAAANPIVTLSFDIYLPSPFQNVYFGQQQGTGSFAQTINDGGWIRVFQGGARTNNGTFPTGQYVNVKMEWDSIAGVRRSWVNGSPLDTAHTFATDNPFDSFNIRVVTDNRPGNIAALAYVDNFKVEAVPEPGTIAAVATGLAGLIGLRRRK